MSRSVGEEESDSLRITKQYTKSLNERLAFLRSKCVQWILEYERLCNPTHCKYQVEEVCKSLEANETCYTFNEILVLLLSGQLQLPVHRNGGTVATSTASTNVIKIPDLNILSLNTSNIHELCDVNIILHCLTVDYRINIALQLAIMVYTLLVFYFMFLALMSMRLSMICLL